MAKFNFSLARLLDMRRDIVSGIERQIEERYAMQKKLRDILHQQRDEYFDDRNEFNEHIRSGQLEKLQIYEQSMELRKQRMLEILTAIREVQGEIDLLQQARVGAKRDVKVVENIEQKRYAEFLHQEEAKERKLFDEQATIGHIRREQAETREENK